MNVDAFVLNRAVCETGLTRIAPITQPDYAGLRLEKSQIRADILSHVNVDYSQPASTNTRISATEAPNEEQVDPSQPQSGEKFGSPLRANRIGVYLHWSLPRMYRAGTMAAEGTKTRDNNQNTSSQPTFYQVPTRWLVGRRIKTSEPPVSAEQREDAWVIESDRLWNIDELGPEVDLETDVSPFVSYTEGDERSPDVLNKQASVYIGAKFPAKGWKELGKQVPRTELTIMNSSNFCFADNTMHNPNVFSMVDNFEVIDEQGNKTILNKVTCDYIVLGWHWNEVSDPLYPKLGVQGLLRDRLRDLFLSPGEGMVSEVQLSSEVEARTVCHGTIYNVSFDRDSKPFTPADDMAKLFTSDIRMEPLAVGSTALDAILSFLSAHENDSENVFGAGTGFIARDLLALSELLYATEDDFDSRVKAADLVSAQNFTTSSGGDAWQYDGKSSVGGKPARPNWVPDGDTGRSELDDLRLVNDLQDQLSTAERRLREVRWALFALWWTFVSDTSNDDPMRQAWYRSLAATLRTEADMIIRLTETPSNGLNDQVENIVRKRPQTEPSVQPLVPARSVPQPPFHQRKDPTLCIAGMHSGWPVEYMGNVPVRSVVDNGNDAEVIFAGQMQSRDIPHALWALGREAFGSEDHGSLLGFKQWTGQPWCPLYLEWEATYFHIPIEKWLVNVVNSPLRDLTPQIRYWIKDRLSSDPRSTADQRAVSGRSILLPQGTINLRALTEQVIDTPGVTLTPEERTELVANVGRLKFITAELNGLTSNLVTTNEGTHVQPNLHVPGSAQDLPLAAAYLAGRDGGLQPQDFRTMGDETAATPYGTSMTDPIAAANAFKGVSHGQMIFTKLNIVDKFGQVISAIPPKPLLRKPDLRHIETAYPCLGDQVCPNLVPGTNHLNTVTALTEADPQLPGSYPLCPYIQITPALNQPARLNAHFVTPKTAANGAFEGWRISDDWDQPVWGWVIVNLADYGLQFFTADGNFYVEMTLGGPNSAVTSPKWLPFDPPSQTSTLVSPQLDQLTKRMTGADGSTYLRSFFQMITKAIETMPYTPPDYAAYATSIVGKPFALVNVGFSLELANAPLRSHVVPSSPLPLGPALPTDPEPLLNYKFPIKIGDKDRPFDGVAGFYDTLNASPGTTDWENLHTYFTSSNANPEPQDPRVPILPENFDTLSPYYIESNNLDSTGFAAAHARQLTVKTMLIDPYTPLHVYTPILPIKSLQLPAWTVQRTLEKISAFFHLGPILLTQDVPPKYNTADPLNIETWLQRQKLRSEDPSNIQIRLPIGGGKKGVWNWLQPYDVPENEEVEGSATRTRYNALEVGEDDPGPYTLVEGFLQLSRPVGAEDA
ncbi:MAG: hypothetical protein Q9209_004484 [Squamulea sp. 1 TL-2023]